MTSMISTSSAEKQCSLLVELGHRVKNEVQTQSHIAFFRNLGSKNGEEHLILQWHGLLKPEK